MVTQADVFHAHAPRCLFEYLLARLGGIADPVILIDAPDPTDPDAVQVFSRERLEVVASSTDDALRRDLLATPADRLDVLVLFGDEMHGWTVDRPPG